VHILTPFLVLKWKSQPSEHCKFPVFKFVIKRVASALITSLSTNMAANFPCQTTWKAWIPDLYISSCASASSSQKLIDCILPLLFKMANNVKANPHHLPISLWQATKIKRYFKFHTQAHVLLLYLELKFFFNLNKHHNHNIQLLLIRWATQYTMKKWVGWREIQRMSYDACFSLDKIRSECNLKDVESR
jgi:hypothetical protein